MVTAASAFTCGLARQGAGLYQTPIGGHEPVESEGSPLVSAGLTRRATRMHLVYLNRSASKGRAHSTAWKAVGCPVMPPRSGSRAAPRVVAKRPESLSKKAGPGPVQSKHGSPEREPTLVPASIHATRARFSSGAASLDEMNAFEEAIEDGRGGRRPYRRV